MDLKVTMIEVVNVVNASEIPDGNYDGILGGYMASSVINDVIYRFKVEPGVRGINIPVSICVSGDKVSIATTR